MICLPFAAPEQGGGGYGFLRLFEKWLTDYAQPWHRSLIKPADVLFVNSWHTSPAYVLAWKVLHRGKVVQRMDGWPPDYGREDGIETRLRDLNRMAHVTIYQSEYSRRRFRGLGFNDGPVIYNPVDLDTFSPGEGELLFGITPPRPRVAVVAWSDNPKKGYDAVYRIAEMHPDVSFVCIGAHWETRTVNIYTVGLLAQRELVQNLRACDALLTMSENEACPNHVLEAMACGLPVLYLDSGATGEIAIGSPIKEADFDIELTMVLERQLGQRAWRYTETHYAPSIIFPKYLEAMK